MPETCSTTRVRRRCIPGVRGSTSKVANQSTLEALLPCCNHTQEREACDLPDLLWVDSTRGIRMHLLRQRLDGSYEASRSRNFCEKGIKDMSNSWGATRHGMISKS